MRIILKLIAAPFALALTLSVGVLSFLLSLSAGVLSVLAFVLGGAGVLMLAVQGDVFNGDRPAGHGLRRLPPWPPGPGGMVCRAAGRSQLLPAGLHHRLTLLVTLARSWHTSGG